VLAELGQPLSEAEYLEHYLGYDDEGVFRTVARDRRWPLSDALLAELIERKSARYEQLAKGDLLFPGAAAFIRRAAAEVPIAIASGALSHEIEEVLHRAGLRECFGAIVGADHVERSKPAPEPYLQAFSLLRALSRRALDPRCSVAIEDSRWGLESARAAGLRTVAVTNTYSAGELAGAAELVVSGLEALSLRELDALCESRM